MFEILCLIGRASLDDDERARLNTLLEALPADAHAALIREAASAGLMPLAYRHLVTDSAVQASSELRAALGTAFRPHATTRFQMARRLREWLGALTTGGVQALAYKGPGLAIQLYGNFAMRQFGDLDILVRPADADAAVAILRQQGLSLAGGRPNEWNDLARIHRHEIAMQSPEGLLVELHWALSDRCDAIDLDLDWFFESHDTIDLLGQPAAVMSRERLALALAVHGSRHAWARLAWLADLAEILRNGPAFDWAVVAMRARKAGFARAWITSVLLTHQLFDVPRPPSLRPDAGTTQLVVTVTDRLRRGASDSVGHAETLRWKWQSADGSTRRLKLLWRNATTLSVRDVPDAAPPASSSWRYAKRGVRLARTLMAERAAQRHRG